MSVHTTGPFARGSLHKAILAHFTQHPANTPLETSAAVTSILEGMGRDPRSGKARHSLRKSFYKLVDKGLAKSTSRGHWALTEHGFSVDADRKAGLSKPTPRKNIDASPPKPITKVKNSPVAVDPGTVFNDDIHLKVKFQRVTGLNSLNNQTVSQVVEVEKTNEEHTATIQAMRKRLEHFKMDRAIRQAESLKVQLGQRLSKALTQQAQLKAEMQDLKFQLKGLDDEPAACADTSQTTESDDDGGDDDEAGDDDPDPDKLKPVEGDRQASPNLTSRWLGKRLTPERGQVDSALMKAMRAAVRSKCPVSATTGKIDDHVQEFLLKIVRRDGLRKKIQAGDNITNSHLASYAVRSAWTDARNAGTEPVERELYGARTERERRDWATNGKPEVLRVRPDGRIIWGGGDGAASQIVGIADAAHTPAESFQQRKDFEILWGRVETVMRSQKPQAWKRYAGILRMKYQGFTTGDIAVKENVSPHRAASMIQEAKSAIRAVGFEGLMGQVRT